MFALAGEEATPDPTRMHIETLPSTIHTRGGRTLYTSIVEELRRAGNETELEMTGVFEIRAGVHFDAAHWLRDYEGPCARMHGHRFDVLAAVTGSELGREQLLMDFHELRRLLEEVIAPFDHQCLNDTEYFADLSPTSENIARFIYAALAERLAGMEADVRLAWVSVSESPDTKVVYREDE